MIFLGREQFYFCRGWFLCCGDGEFQVQGEYSEGGEFSEEGNFSGGIFLFNLEGSFPGGICFGENFLVTIVKLYAFWQRINFGNFQLFFHHNCRLKTNFWMLMISSKRSSSDLSKYTLFQIENFYFIFKFQLLGEK